MAEPLVNMPTARLIGSAWLIALEALVKEAMLRLKSLRDGESAFGTVKEALLR